VADPINSSQDLHEVTDVARFPGRTAADRARLLVLRSGTVVAHPLPVEGTVTLGRSDESDIRIDDPSISRIHVAITVGRNTFKVRDLASRNGTRLRGTPLQPNVDLAFDPGDPIDVGSSSLLVMLGEAASRVWRLCSHGYFELRVEEECDRAKSAGSPFAIVRIRVRGDAIPSRIEEALTAFLGSRDLIALYAPNEYEILLIDTNRSQAEQADAGIRFGLSRLGAEVQIGLACFPQDGQTSEMLIARAGEGVHGPPLSGLGLPGQTLVVVDEPMRRLYELVDRIAPSDLSVLVMGETGVGKEELAKAIHARSKRSSQSFLPINCGALTEELLESELFGHERGAFTGAMKTKLGLLESAQGGTVFLDEIGEMPMSTQVALLRVLEERRARRVGGLEARLIDVRFIAATNRELEREMESGRFRSDLYYRLAGFTIVIPALRDRPSEIMPLAKVFAAQILAREGLGSEPRFTAQAMALLSAYEWPGNVRELRNVIERAVVLAGGGAIGLEHLPHEKLTASRIIGRTAPPPSKPEMPPATPRSRAPTNGGSRPEAETWVDRPGVFLASTLEIGPNSPSPSDVDTGPLAKVKEAANELLEQLPKSSSLSSEIEELEKRRVIEALEACVGNQTRAAKMLGISRKALISRIERYGIPRPRKGWE
jgi:two-component system, NtrC family, response regulator AtoC